MPETRITIVHTPRGHRIAVTSPGGDTRLYIEASPAVALHALADFLTRWADDNG